MNKYAILVVVAVMAVVGVFIYSNFIGSESDFVVRTYPENSLTLQAGNSTHPTFCSWQFECESGDRVELQIHATSWANLWIIPDNAHQAWVDEYEEFEYPMNNYPHDQALASLGDSKSVTITFTAPKDGVFDLVALNTRDSTSTVTVSGEVHRSK